MTPDPWDETQEALKGADMALAAMLASLPDDMSHHAARNRLVSAMGSVEDAAMYCERARTLVGALDV